MTKGIDYDFIAELQDTWTDLRNCTPTHAGEMLIVLRNRISSHGLDDFVDFAKGSFFDRQNLI